MCWVALERVERLACKLGLPASTGAWTQAWLNIAVTTTVAIGLCLLGMAAGRHLIGLRG